MQRFARAHGNCVEGLPIFGGLMIVALVTGKLAITLRFSAFAVQMAIGIYWAVPLVAV